MIIHLKKFHCIHNTLHFQSRVLKKVQGEKYKKKLVTDEECRNKIEELSQGMMMVYSYVQGTFNKASYLAVVGICIACCLVEV